MSVKNAFGAATELKTSSGSVTYFSLPKLAAQGVGNIEKLPYSMRVLLEACLRNVDDFVVNESDVVAVAQTISGWGFAITPDALQAVARDIGETTVLARAGVQF